MKRFFHSLIAIFLTLAILLSTTSCAIHSTTTCEYNPDEDFEVWNSSFSFVAESTGNDGYVEEMLEVTGKEARLSEKGTADNVFYLTKESSEDYSYITTDWDSISQKQKVFDLAFESIAYDLYEAGFDVFRAYAVVNDRFVPGIAFTTNNKLYEESEEGIEVYECGFFEIVEDGNESNISQEAVKQGVAVVPAGEGIDTSIGFIISLGASLESYSGIYLDKFFRYDQIDDYTVAVKVCENTRNTYDESIDLFNFDTGKFVFHGDMSYHSISASPYFSDEAKAMAAARDAIDQVIEIQNSFAYQVEKQVIILFTEEVLNEYLLNQQQGSINGFLLEQINGIKLEKNQFVIVTTDGVSIETVVDTDALAKDRLTNGVIGAIGSAILVGGSILFALATAGAGAPVAITAIGLVASTGAAVYGVSNLIESSQEIYNGAKGDITSHSINPLLEGFKALIPDPKAATMAYYIFGISSSIVQALVIPAGTALGLVNSARATGATVTAWQATLLVTRAVVVEAVKIGITAAVSAGVGYITNKAVSDLGFGDWGKVDGSKILGFAVGALAGAFSYRGLTKIDARYNFSGLHSKIHLKVPKADLTKEEVVKQFSEDKWADMTDYEKRIMIEKMRDMISDQLGLREKPGIRYYNSSDKNSGCGYYSDRSNTININEHYMNGNIKNPASEMLDTIAHELRHAYQYQNLGIDEVSRSYINYVEYKPRLGNWDAYYYQKCEVDSRHFAELWVQVLKGLTK